MSTVPDVVQSLCPGCGRTGTAFPCPTCGTESPSRHDPQPAETTAPAVLFLGMSLFAASGLFLFLVPAPWGPVGGVVLGAIGTAMSGLATWALRDPPRPWQIVAPGAVGIGVVQKGALLYTHGQRTETHTVDPAEHAALAGVERDALRQALRDHVDAPEKSAAAWAPLWLLARVARGEARAEQTTVVRWADGSAQDPEITLRELRPAPDPEDVAPFEPSDATAALSTWVAAHPALFQSLTHL